MLFSVIIPTYNRLEYLQATLDSVWQQTFKDFEVIVVDDGSTDGTVPYVSSLKEKVSLLQQSNAGPGVARNLGMRHAKGEYLAFLDSDDLWFPWTLETYAKVIEEVAHPAFLAGKRFQFRDEAQLMQASDQTAKHLRFKDYLASGDEWRWWGASSFVMQREAVLARGGFADKNMNAEDADLALRLGTEPGFVQITAPVTFGYREHDSNITAVLDKSLTGLWHIIKTESVGGYDGGPGRAQERWRVITRQTRPLSLACLRTPEKRSEGWKMYRATFRWHVAISRWKFLIGFPLYALMYRARAADAGAPQS